MAIFDVFQRAMDAGDNAGGDDADASVASESQHTIQGPSAVETLLGQTLAKSNTTLDSTHSTTRPRAKAPASILGAVDCKNQEIVRLQHSLTELKTAHQARELQLRATKGELDNARHALSEKFVEYSRLRDEIKSVRKTMAREHQSIIYRKDIELFALRKGNEQKERNIAERDTRLEIVAREQRATLQAKDTQLRMLYERLAIMERQADPKFGNDMKFEDSSSDGDHALEVRLLRVRKGRKSPTAEDEKDMIIAKLQEDLAAASKTAEKIVDQQAELQRAWDMAKKIQAALNEERGNHAQTKTQLQTAATETEDDAHASAQADSSGRLPTIEEHDQNELESMFDTAQQDNLRLYTEVESLDKRLRDANARMFAAEKDAETLKEQVRLEQAINQDMEAARPSMVHRVHFQRMEGQLKDCQSALAAKEKEIGALKFTAAEKDQELKDQQIELDAAAKFHTQDQDEIEQLKLSLSEIRIANEKLMRDHERLASHRARHRVISAEHISARSSGATLIPFDSTSPTNSSDSAPVEAHQEPVPVIPAFVEKERQNSIQQTPEQCLRKQTPTPREQPSMISNDTPPAELRAPSALKVSKRKSMGLMDLMKRMVKKEKDTDVQEQPNKLVSEEKERERQRHVTADKNRNAMLRPKTAASELASTTPLLSNKQPDVEMRRPTTSALPKNVKPDMTRRITSRYYATQSTDNILADNILRPQTPAGDLKAVVKDESERPSSRAGRGTSTKLKRRSLF
ncbi:hypothetical protein P153DRAFT_340952 [Dothidotthia symphoricarpi CBS 119687]|uniref:Uncharacterized protein n=1 Tax=Dothidotthia symphoricarpi CBS 119687 TaxID=1392245 RepID=A0A6A6AAB6_9PLEO|nr:uncharacterized protein P153DRAFT_340952 [Dothidotthia symphoricarpi CBS 119687]KAF2128760.1 hypothetical protein P153DRAFT_340952 [Dothidotthia symphoricarpi CBS 119687]